MNIRQINSLIQQAGYHLEDNVVKIKKSETDLEVTERKNKENQERVAKERAEANKKVLRQYRIKH